MDITQTPQQAFVLTEAAVTPQRLAALQTILDDKAIERDAAFARHAAAEREAAALEHARAIVMERLCAKKAEVVALRRDSIQRAVAAALGAATADDLDTTFPQEEFFHVGAGEASIKNLEDTMVEIFEVKIPLVTELGLQTKVDLLQSQYDLLSALAENEKAQILAAAEPAMRRAGGALKIDTTNSQVGAIMAKKDFVLNDLNTARRELELFAQQQREKAKAKKG
jgi:hypothetical protein